MAQRRQSFTPPERPLITATAWPAGYRERAVEYTGRTTSDIARACFSDHGAPLVHVDHAGRVSEYHCSESSTPYYSVRHEIRHGAWTQRAS